LIFNNYIKVLTFLAFLIKIDFIDLPKKKNHLESHD